VHHVAKVSLELDQLVMTAMSVTDDVEGTVVRPTVVPEWLTLERGRLDLVLAGQNVDTVKPLST
jgi:hypothetical protein